MRFPLVIVLLMLSGVAGLGADLAATLVADGFDLPVGKPNGEGYYRSRGYRANGHLGEDWNGKGGGDTDLGAPVYTIANGIVVLAQNFGHGWGNVVIVRHVYEELGELRQVDSLYAHLDRILVRHGQTLRRGHPIGTIGTAGGLYEAHLHFELRKDPRVGMARHRFPQDDRVYWSPMEFISTRRRLRPGISVAAVRMNTFVEFDPAVAGGKESPKGFRLPAKKTGAK
jgi:murein DD-endopeptidase MepM/ murein hydrolase activator NlpD